MGISTLPFPQGAGQFSPSQAPVAGIVPQPQQPAAPTNPLQELAGNQGGAPQSIPQGGELAAMQDFFSKIQDPQARLQLASILGQSVPAPSLEELQQQLTQLSAPQQGGV